MNHIISHKSTLIEALRALNDLSGDVMTLFVVDENRTMVGTLTDGDVRRALLSGLSLQSEVSDAMHRNFRYLTTVSSPMDVRMARRSGISLLPILDEDRKILDILDLSRQTTRLPIRAVLMAGGRGERLRPLTDSVPKPLLPLGGATVIDRNVEALQRCGVGEIYVTIRYLAEQLEAHFEGSEVKCVRENMPLGTIGSLSLIPQGELTGVTLVMNSDLFTNIDFEEFYVQHIEQGNDISIATVSHTVSIPFAVLATEGLRVTDIEEKPTYTHYANAGIYLISNRLLSGLKSEHIDAPDFIADHIQRGAKVGHFPISGTWLDIGTPADYQQAQELLGLLPY